MIASLFARLFRSGPGADLRAAQAGDRAAIERFYRRSRRRPAATFIYYRVGRDTALAEDVVQETFALALSRRADHDPARGSIMPSWLTVLSRNVIRDHLKAHRRSDELATAWERIDATLAQTFSAMAERPLPGEVLERAETRDLVHMAVANLPEQYRTALTRKYVDGESLGDAGRRARDLDGRRQVSPRPRPARVPRHVRDAVDASLGGCPMKPDLTPDTTDADGSDLVLERNVTTLLETGGEPPRLEAAPRADPRAPDREARHAGAPALAAPGGGAGPRRDRGGRGDRHPRRRRRRRRRARQLSPRAASSATARRGSPSRARAWTCWRRAACGSRAPRCSTWRRARRSPSRRRRARSRSWARGSSVEASAERTTAAVVRGAVKLASPAARWCCTRASRAWPSRGHPPTRGPAPRLSHLVSWAAKARAQDEQAIAPLRNGTLFAREPNRPGVPESPLPIQKLVVDVTVENQVARVALDQTFHNPAPQVMEGMYRFAIPPDASLQRLAMYVNGTLTESAVVERMAARRIYEDVVYRRLDPALLEWAGTGRLALRVYPLPPQRGQADRARVHAEPAEAVRGLDARRAAARGGPAGGRAAARRPR